MAHKAKISFDFILPFSIELESAKGIEAAEVFA